MFWERMYHSVLYFHYRTKPINHSSQSTDKIISISFTEFFSKAAMITAWCEYTVYCESRGNGVKKSFQTLQKDFVKKNKKLYSKLVRIYERLDELVLFFRRTAETHERPVAPHTACTSTSSCNVVSYLTVDLSLSAAWRDQVSKKAMSNAGLLTHHPQRGLVLSRMCR